MSTLDDFFAPSYDTVEGECKCLECLEVSSKQGSGHWVAEGQLWVCDDCWPEHQAHEQAEQAKINETIARVQAGKHTNADLDFLVSEKVAYRVYNDPDSNRPTGIEFL
jgi:hypothetical protein